MKLIILLTVVSLVSGDYSSAQSEHQSDSYVTPVSDHSDTTEEKPSPSSSPLDLTKSYFNFPTGFTGAFPPAAFPHTNFLTKNTFSNFKFPLKSFSYPSTFSAASPGILPPQLSQVVPPISNILPPISNVVPPVFGNSKPTFPVNPPQVLPPAPAAPTFPPQLVTPQTLSKPTQLFTSSQFPNFNYNFAFPSFNQFYKTPYAFSSYPAFPSTSLFSAPFPAHNEPAKAQEPCTNYGPPATEAPASFEPSGPAESSAPFEPAPAPVSFPYEPAQPDTPEPASAPYQPAQEYGVPN